jgi:hypothetical protein
VQFGNPEAVATALGQVVPSADLGTKSWLTKSLSTKNGSTNDG